MFNSQNFVLNGNEQPRPLLDTNIPLNVAEAWNEYALRNYDIVPSDEDLERDIPRAFVEQSLNTPLCDFRSLMHRLQDNISENHRQRILDGKESFNKINDALLAQSAQESIALSHNDLNDLLKRQEPYSVPYVIDVDKICDKFERGESFGTLQDNSKRQRQKAEDHQDNSSSTLLSNPPHFEMHDHQDESMPNVRKRAAPNPPQLSASMLAAAAKRIQEVDSSDSDPNESQPVPNIVISSVKSLALKDVSTPDTVEPRTDKVKGLVPILPKPTPQPIVTTATPATTLTVSSSLSSSTRLATPSILTFRAIAPNVSTLRPTMQGGIAQQAQRPVYFAYVDKGGEIKLINPTNTITNPVTTTGVASPRFLLRSTSGVSRYISFNSGATGIPQFPNRGSRPLILGTPVRSAGLRNMTVVSHGRGRPPLNMRTVRLISTPAPQAVVNKPPEVPLQATPFRVTVTSQNNEELSETNRKFSSGLTPGSSPAFGTVSASSLLHQDDNADADKILGF